MRCALAQRSRKLSQDLRSDTQCPVGWVTRFESCPKLSQQLAPSAGLRNRLVHEYDDIDSRIVYQAMSLDLELYQEYMQEIQDYIGRQ